MSPGSSIESYQAFAHIGLMENPGKNLNQITCPDRESNPDHLVSRPDALTGECERPKTTFTKLEQRFWIKIEMARGRNAQECFQELREACGDAALPYRLCELILAILVNLTRMARWVKAFREGLVGPVPKGRLYKSRRFGQGQHKTSIFGIDAIRRHELKTHDSEPALLREQVSVHLRVYVL
ncbi:hypothetical protein ANN_02337 [Periplaneta americana]|uniref:Transposase DDE domain-containing protein n=1 Tax=Periplaneta americana TaxID=6978 RepID=A0ABQ8TYH3_PERAM|nr:hypothetical protein ANN_02337 [Periplaneta americana]